ncbi:hypothetical protein AV530_018148 [Patagioenas fasciata monilis]|uniref:Uncharacterized protein n=1 Tax=Patagioenas fasciata monilis TaxID=372326 RepID=A0A1V4KL46_PATFA|nr:hypothetical protein AV530_018148 [Patagioenas fasciata monilis]
MVLLRMRAGEGLALPSEAVVLAAVAPTSLYCVHVMENRRENTVPNRSAQTSGQKFVLAKSGFAVDEGKLKNSGQENSCSGTKDMVSVARSYTNIKSAGATTELTKYLVGWACDREGQLWTGQGWRKPGSCCSVRPGFLHPEESREGLVLPQTSES